MNEKIRMPEGQTMWPLALAMAILVFFTAWSYVKLAPIGQPPDEWAQLSYVADVTSGGPLIPDYSNSKLLTSGQPNYLKHPPLYYTVLGVVGKTLSWDAKKDYQRYRSISAMMVSLGAFFWVLTAGGLGFTKLQAVGLTGASIAIPMFPYLAGSVNNDNLCYLAVSVFFYGFILLPSRCRRGIWICTLGLLTALLTKATATVFLLAFLITWCCLDRDHLRSLIKNKHLQAATIISTVICTSYFLPTFIRYHAFFPAPGGLYLDSTAPLQPVGLVEFSGSFISTMYERLPLILLSKKALSPIPRELFTLFHLMLIIPLIAWLLVRPFSTQSPRRRLADAFLSALLVTLTIHLWVAWQGYLQTGLYAGLQPRYYAFTLPGLFLFTFADGIERRFKSTLAYCFALIAVVFAALIPPNAVIEQLDLKRQSHTSFLRAPGLSMSPASTIGVGGSGPLAGVVDRIDIRGRQVKLVGWAIDADSKKPTRALWVSFQNQLIGTAQPVDVRPDVANALKSKSALRAGFEITVSHLPANLSPCDISVQAEQDNGTLATLRNPSCVKTQSE